MAQNPEAAKEVAVNIVRYRPHYDPLATLTGLPWWIIGIHHYLEPYPPFSMDHHLANGEPLTRRTKSEPKGIPQGGTPPFGWHDCALEVLKSKLRTIAPWNLSTIWGACYWLEAWNGWGYALYHPETPTQYLYSKTNAGREGKYGSDGEWSPNLTSDQIGAVAIIKSLESMEAIDPLMHADLSDVVPIRVGLRSKGLEVVEIQQALKALQPGASIKIDGDWGPKTQAIFALTFT